MSKISVVFDKNSGLNFFTEDEGEKTHKHEISIKNLEGMSLSQFEYAVATNLLIDLPELQAIFADYLWQDNGEVPPRLPPDHMVKREPQETRPLKSYDLRTVGS